MVFHEIICQHRMTTILDTSKSMHRETRGNSGTHVGAHGESDKRMDQDGCIETWLGTSC